MKKVVLFSLMLASVSVLPVCVSASQGDEVKQNIVTDEGEIGGWSEDSGAYNLSSNHFRASSPKHYGERQQRSAGRNMWDRRAHGWTNWSGKHHYTTARMEKYDAWSRKWVVVTTSGRKWGRNGTEAYSPWARGGEYDPNKARTYYGS
ncbi:hypothetical protein [Candidatus Enterococcus mansonii]|uniref:Lactococcin 972 family bacteriocin n=1 Tax=Candidatus Enterococcus mansonii TaxID=1834181 RepID=A0A242CIS2_9ENTE|nr:hypothetical protein [Enterococcus sp. 4G2_DIV0659]OTO09800.1 hypothetical protein A5880_000483 [Enterococcus sp. 4G2_DIV0659]